MEPIVWVSATPWDALCRAGYSTRINGILLKAYCSNSDGYNLFAAIYFRASFTIIQTSLFPRAKHQSTESIVSLSFRIASPTASQKQKSSDSEQISNKFTVYVSFLVQLNKVVIQKTDDDLMTLPDPASKILLRNDMRTAEETSPRRRKYKLVQLIYFYHF